jgi:hypothetical protein
MPKEGAMTQISRPFQIALLGVGLLAAVWFFALQGHSASTAGSSPSASAPAAVAAQSAKTGSSSASVSGSSSANEPAATQSHVYHGSAPGVEGLTRAIAKAHEAVATSRLNEKQLAEKSAQASSSTPSGASGDSAPGTAPTAATTAPVVPKTSTSPVVRKASTHTHAATVHVKSKPVTTHSVTAPKIASSPSSTPSSGSAKSVPPMQAAVEAELKQGKTVAILFWNSKASVDQTVQRELKAVGHTQGGKLAIHDARAAQVGLFGSITRDVQVFQTPTILIVNKHGQTTSMTGLTDGFAIEQAIAEARHS